MNTVKLITYKGQTHSIAEWARIIGLSGQTLHDRFKRDWPVDSALSEPIHTKGTPQVRPRTTSKKLTITYGDETHTLREWSNLTNISYHTLFYRLKAGWDADLILTTSSSERIRHVKCKDATE